MHVHERKQVMMPFQLRWKFLNSILYYKAQKTLQFKLEATFTQNVQILLKENEASKLVPGISMSPMHPLKDGSKAVSAASSRQLFKFNITKGLNHE